MDIKSLFDNWAKTLNGHYHDQQWLLSRWEVEEGIPWPQEKTCAMINNIVNTLNITSAHSLIDLGCGGGWILKAVSPYAGSVIGTDFSMPMLTNALKTCPEKIFICGDLKGLPFKDNSFERALCYFVFINFPDDNLVKSAILEIQRVLKNGGRALIGQLPDKDRSGDYDKANKDYQAYCAQTYNAGKNYRDICRLPQRLYDRQDITHFLEKENILYQCLNSFNPFYRQGQAQTVEWRFDIVMEKK